jgi:hypothetical protein
MAQPNVHDTSSSQLPLFSSVILLRGDVNVMVDIACVKGEEEERQWLRSGSASFEDVYLGPAYLFFPKFPRAQGFLSSMRSNYQVFAL